ncbi:hypothetical protein FHS16_002540 [Paenibacillus endophyticus]|uniref:Glycoside hydrolase family 42 N-terminal domain-containing protein n=1 Tax=Paenibacillus endophyticus TaxID=1294268 RepID=A0A7W5C854_9BACL|nr:hypothetical protein [Paenibacillus endophyticus]MBB3152490.1 hypothetical protein [Paenibacillus endophyticus]
MTMAPIMLLIDTSMAAQPDSIRLAVADIAGKGFDAIALEFRNCSYSEFDEIGQRAMRTTEEEARKHGLAFIQIIPWPGLRLLKRYPEARQKWISEHAGTIRNGKLEIRVNDLESAGHIDMRPVYEGIAKAFLIKREGGIIREAKDITAELRDVSLAITSRSDLSGTYGVDGEVLLYASYSTDYPDYASPNMTESIDETLACYRGMKLDGFAMDEFGAGSKKEDVYLGGAAFLEAFRQSFGYDFLDRIYLMQHEAGDERSGKLRYDYYNLTVDLTYRIQKQVKERYEEQHGQASFKGFHSTWWGEGNSGDLWAGNIDYFKLTENLSGGFVDSQYDAERTMLSMTMLAESLAKYSDSGLAYNMCWDREPTTGKMNYYHRLLAARNVRWVAHAYGHSGPFGPGYPHHPTWEMTRRCVAMQKAMQRFVGKAVSRPRVAMMYVWESVAHRNDPFMHYHRLSMKALLHKLMLRHVEIDVVPTFEEDLSRYDALIVLWPAMLPEATWERIRRYDEMSGKRLIFIGPPAACTTEGRDISAEFAELTGTEVHGCASGDRRRAQAPLETEYPGEYEYVAWDLWFTNDRIPMKCFPLSIVGGAGDAKVIIRHDDLPIAARKGNVDYYAFELPLTPYCDSLLHELEGYKELQLPPNMLSKTSYDDDGTILTLMPQLGGELNVSFRYAGIGFEIRGGGLVGLRILSGRLSAAISEEGAELYVNGERVDESLIERVDRLTPKFSS